MKKESILGDIGLFFIGLFVVVAALAFGVVIDTGTFAAIIFCLNAGFHWCLGWTWLGVSKTFATALLASLVTLTLRVVRKVLD